MQRGVNAHKLMCAFLQMEMRLRSAVSQCLRRNVLAILRSDGVGGKEITVVLRLCPGRCKALPYPSALLFLLGKPCGLAYHLFSVALGLVMEAACPPVFNLILGQNILYRPFGLFRTFLLQYSTHPILLAPLHTEGRRPVLPPSAPWRKCQMAELFLMLSAAFV